jgi:hypothetical protein
LISNEDDGEFVSGPAKLILQFGKGLIMGRVPNIEGFDFEGGEHCLQCWKITLKNDLAGLAILGIEKIDLDGRRGLRDSMNREREENKDREGNKKFSHFGPLRVNHSPKHLNNLSAFLIY